MGRFLIRLSVFEFILAVLLGLYGIIFGEFNSQNLFLMISIGIYVGSGFTLIIGLFSGMLMEKR